VVRYYAATQYPAPIPLESAVDDLMETEYPADWWDGCEFEVRDYTFAAVE
jgi:hypothetical protein